MFSQLLQEPPETVYRFTSSSVWGYRRWRCLRRGRALHQIIHVVECCASVIGRAHFNSHTRMWKLFGILTIWYRVCLRCLLLPLFESHSLFHSHDFKDLFLDSHRCELCRVVIFYTHLHRIFSSHILVVSFDYVRYSFISCAQFATPPV